MITVQPVQTLISIPNQKSCAIEGDTPIVPDNSASPVGIRQTGNNPSFASITDFLSVGIKNPLIMRFAIVGKNHLDLRVQFIPIRIDRRAYHPDAAIWHYGAF